MENKKNNNKKKPLKLSSTGRLQLRKNLGPYSDKNKGNKKTIQIVFRNKNNQQKSSSTTQSNFRGSSSFRTMATSGFNTSKNLNGMNNKMLALLAVNDITTLDDFADLATFDLIDKEEGIFKDLDIEEKVVNDMIMKAREKWFKED